jgi:hypothetical protein
MNITSFVDNHKRVRKIDRNGYIFPFSHILELIFVITKYSGKILKKICPTQTLQLDIATHVVRELCDEVA